MTDIAIVAHNLRSSHNVGSLLRTAEGLGVITVWLTGYTPYPVEPKDERLPHIQQKVSAQIHKTALGAETLLAWRHSEDAQSALTDLRRSGYKLAALEQSDKANSLTDFQPPERLALIVGNEVSGLKADIIEQCDIVLEIPMLGKKESYNVVQAAAMALYHCRFRPI